MTLHNTETYDRARAFICRNARPLDLARFQYHFENGAAEAVLSALAAYQNADGGFGHALEPDAWNPNSAPMQTWTATEILREIGITDSAHPIIQGILRYLESGHEFGGKFWANSPSSNNDYPHAPWWHVGNDSASNTDYNPTACLAGFIIRFAYKDSELYNLGCRIAREAYDAYFAQDLLGDMHTAGCYLRLMQYIEEASADTIDRSAITDMINMTAITALKERLRAQVKHSITADFSQWEAGYICRPSHFFSAHNGSFDKVLYADNKVTADYECGYIVRTQQHDGAWSIPWSWNNYPEEWSVSKNWWKSNGVILNLLYLRGIG